MKTGILLLSFGEPESPDPVAVTAYLERIFTANAALMGPATPEQVRERSRRLAEERAPGLVEEYLRIGGSPLHRQAWEQAEALEAELVGRGHDAVVLLGMQFTEPGIGDAVELARRSGVERLVGLPVYPLAGPSTTLAALADLRREVECRGWRVELREITGWHRHPAYVRVRGDAIRGLLARDGLSLADPGTRLVFSAHGTPLRYLEEGSRYDRYVSDFCARLAADVGAPTYRLGFQNHGNRPGVAWTQPEIGAVVAEVEARRIVVDAVSFMHEQSETLAELDHELRAEAEGRGLGFHRVPIPYAAPAFIRFLADLVGPLLDGAPAGELRRCRCRPGPQTYCLNAADPAA